MSDIIDDIDEFVAEHSDIPGEYANTGSSLRELIDSLIAAAVQAEREACAQEAEVLYAGWDEIEMGRWPDARDAAAAIRARSSAQEERTA